MSARIPSAATLRRRRPISEPQIADAPGSTELVQRIPAYERLTPAKIALILKLADDGQSQTAIAQLLGCTQPTVSRCLTEFADTRELAKRLAHSHADKLTKRVIDQADVDQSLEVLDRIGVLEKREKGHGGVAVQVNVGGPWK